MATPSEYRRRVAGAGGKASGRRQYWRYSAGITDVGGGGAGGAGDAAGGSDVAGGGDAGGTPELAGPPIGRGNLSEALPIRSLADPKPWPPRATFKRFGPVTSARSMQSQKGENCANHDDETDQINNSVHCSAPSALFVPAVTGNTWSEEKVLHADCRFFPDVGTKGPHPASESGAVWRERDR